MKFTCAKDLKLWHPEISIQAICEELNISRSGFYAWSNRGLSFRDQENETLKQKIVQIHEHSRKTYGQPRIQAVLNQEGIQCGKNRIAKLMKKAGISGLIRPAFKPQTTDSDHSYSVAERLFKTEDITTHPTKANQVWVGDISYLPTAEGFTYLATYLDVFTRKIVGFSMQDTLETQLILDALDMALKRQGKLKSSLLCHSDRGVQYASERYQETLKTNKIQISMSRKAHCLDNAFAESFFATLKKECVYRTRFKTKAEAHSVIFEFIEVWYNRKRLHSQLNYQTPVQFEESLVA